MENEVLSEMCEKLISNFVGVYSSDRIPLKCYKLKNFCMILNLDSHNEPGSHFVSIHYKNNYLEYFDSYGLPPIIPKIIDFIRYLTTNKNAALKINKKKIQSNTSMFCGLFCLGHLMSKNLMFTMDDYVSIYSKNTLELNDELVVYFITNVLKFYAISK